VYSVAQRRYASRGAMQSPDTNTQMIHFQVQQGSSDIVCDHTTTLTARV
jgi:hypothetical protein